MDIRQLRAFNAVIEYGRVSAAARKIGLTQPAISKIVRGLEEEVGVGLFLREKGRLIPTPEAMYLQNIGKNVIDQINDAKQFLKDYGNKKYGELKIFSIPGPSLHFIPDLISHFLEEHNGVRAHILSWNTSEVVNWIANHQTGVGLAEWIRPHPSVRLHQIKLPCLCAMAISHPLASKALITPLDLQNENLSVINSEHQLHVAIQAAFADAGLTPNIRLQSNLFVPVFSIIERTHIVGIIDPINARNYQLYSRSAPRLVFRPFSPQVHLSLSVVVPAFGPPSQLAAAFAEKLIKSLEDLSSNVSSLVRWN